MEFQAPCWRGFGKGQGHIRILSEKWESTPRCLESLQGCGSWVCSERLRKDSCFAQSFKVTLDGIHLYQLLKRLHLRASAQPILISLAMDSLNYLAQSLFFNRGGSRPLIDPTLGKPSFTPAWFWKVSLPGQWFSWYCSKNTRFKVRILLLDSWFCLLVCARKGSQSLPEPEFPYL